jgi:hypothetical protein
MVDIPSQNPFQPPEAAVLEQAWDPLALPPVPWEDTDAYPGFWQRVGAMFSLLFSNPMELADRIPVTDGLAPAWRFNLVMAIPYFAFTGLIFAFMGSIFAFTPSDPNLPKGLMAGIFGGELVLILLIYCVGMFVAGAIAHAALWMWGGTRGGAGLGQTIRTCGYIWGFVNLGMLVPCVNLFVMLGGIVYLGMALARIHRTDTWRGICAVLTPYFICCLGYAALLLAGFTLGAFNH